ncbi:unnamed protein product, partial [marine sediment metagenome]
LVITTEELIDTEEIRNHPDRTAVPFFLVDAVCGVPYGSHPGNMPGLYYSDEEHIAEWLRLSRTDEGVEEYLEKYVHSVEGFPEYVEKIGGAEKMEYLARLERLEVPLEAPWARR